MIITTLTISGNDLHQFIDELHKTDHCLKIYNKENPYILIHGDETIIINVIDNQTYHIEHIVCGCDPTRFIPTINVFEERCLELIKDLCQKNSWSYEVNKRGKRKLKTIVAN
jgi:hypothetical protein